MGMLEKFQKKIRDAIRSGTRTNCKKALAHGDNDNDNDNDNDSHSYVGYIRECAGVDKNCHVTLIVSGLLTGIVTLENGVVVSC